jgi:transcriptional regulator with XRE-family HTH domain
MAERNLDISALSARTDISDSYLARILRGDVTNPTVDFVIRIANGLGVTESDVLGRKSLQTPGAVSTGAYYSPPLVDNRSDVGGGDGPHGLELDDDPDIPPFIRSRSEVVEVVDDLEVIEVVDALEGLITNTALSHDQKQLAYRLILGAARGICAVFEAESQAAVEAELPQDGRARASASVRDLMEEWKQRQS